MISRFRRDDQVDRTDPDYILHCVLSASVLLDNSMLNFETMQSRRQDDIEIAMLFKELQLRIDKRLDQAYEEAEKEN